MKRLGQWVITLSILLISCWVFLGWTQSVVAVTMSENRYQKPNKFFL